MINSMCGIMGNLKSEMGSLKSENSCTKPGPTSPDDQSWVSESKKSSTPQWTSAQLMKQNSSTPSSLSFPAIKFEDDMEVKSPDSSLWESFFSDNLADGDFMISSPVRNVLPSPQASSSYNYNYNSVHESMHGQSLLGCSPPRVSYQLGAASSSHNKAGKGMSPLHKVFSSPKNNNNNNNNPNQQQHMQLSAESLSLLPALESLLDIDDYDEIRDDPECFIDHYKAVRLKNNNSALHVGSSSSDTTFDTIPALLECLTVLPDTSRFCGSVSETSVPGTTSQLTQESHDLYQMAASSIATTAPLSQQLQQQPPKKEKQQQEQTLNINQSFIMPLSVMPEQVQEQDSGLELVHLLLACAEAVAKEDYMLARRYLQHLNRVVTPLGNSMQRVASFFTEALSARLAATTPKPPFPTNSLEVLKIYQILYQACPYIKFAHFTANQAIFEAFEEEECVHVIDLDINQGYQWPAFMQALAARPGGAPSLRITGVGSSLESVRETGWCLTELAHSLGIPFEFHPVGEQLEDLKPHMFQRRVGEALAVNSVSRLHSVPAGNCLGNLLAMIRDQAPSIVTIVEQEASHNGPYFLGRFLEALHYYSAIFDSLDATFPPDSAQRAKVEHYIFAPEIRNVVACEGQERVVRHERLDKWRKLMEGKGFTGVPLSENAVTQSNILLSVYSCDGYSLKEDKGCLLLGWQDRSILAASAWRC